MLSVPKLKGGIGKKKTNAALGGPYIIVTPTPRPPLHQTITLPWNYISPVLEKCVFFSLSFLSCVVVIVNNWTLLNQSKLYVGNSPVFITANTGMVCRPFWMISSSWSRAKSTRQLQSRGTKHKHTHRGKSTGKIKIERLKAFDLGVPILLSLPFFSTSSSQPEVRGYIYIQRRRGGGTRKGFFFLLGKTTKVVAKVYWKKN